jgi:hypothetical protein
MSSMRLIAGLALSRFIIGEKACRQSAWIVICRKDRNVRVRRSAERHAVALLCGRMLWRQGGAEPDDLERCGRGDGLHFGRVIEERLQACHSIDRNVVDLRHLPRQSMPIGGAQPPRLKAALGLCKRRRRWSFGEERVARQGQLRITIAAMKTRYRSQPAALPCTQRAPMDIEAAHDGWVRDALRATVAVAVLPARPHRGRACGCGRGRQPVE